MIDLFPFDGKKPAFTNEQRERSWKAVGERLYAQSVVGLNTQRNWKRFAAAAAVVALIAIAFWQWQAQSNNAYKQYTTNFGETQRVILPDQSIVVLNSNSTLKIPNPWPTNSVRNVWLAGEAYFEVAKDKGQFVVHTNNLQVKVLGTKFNVNAYGNEPVVELKEGRIEVVYTQKAAAKTIVMKPGQQLTMKAAEAAAPSNLLPVDGEFVADWTQNNYHFSNTPLPEIGTMIYNRFGYTMLFADQSLAQRNMQGTLTAATLAEFVDAIEATMSLDIETNDIDRTLFVKP